jgi:hypothetical protein
METIIVHPKNKEQLTALKAIMKALKVDFTTEKSTEDYYGPEFNAKMKRGEEDIKMQEGLLKLNLLIYGT